MKKNKRKIYEGEVLKDYRELVDRYKTRYANNIAFEYKKEVHDKEHIKITYAEFARDIEALGSGLLTLDFINKRVAIISPNRYEWCTSYLAVGTAGLTVVPLDKSLPNNEIENVIKRAECIDDAIAMTVETNGKKEIVAAVVEKYEKGNASHQVFMNEENPEYAEIQEIRKKVVAAFILKVYGNNVDSLTPNDNIVINSNGKVEQYWNVWLLINNVISHKDSDEYVLNLEIKNVLSDIWYMKLETQIPMVQELIRGTVSASNLLTNGYLSPEELLVQGSDTVIFLEHVTKVIKHDSKVAVLGARTGLAVEMLLNNNLDRNVELTLIDESAGMLKRAEERLRRYPLYGRMADTGIIGVLTHDGYMVEAD